MRDLLIAMSPERLEVLYTSLPDGSRVALDVAIAKVLNSRMETLRRRPMALKLKALHAWFQRSRDDEMALEVIRSYFLGPRQDLVTSFLDGTGVAHEEGQIEDDKADPDGAKVPDTVAALLKDHDREDVALYLQVAARQWPEVPALGEALESLSA